MINNFLNVSEYAVLGFVGVVFAYLLTSFLLAIGMNKLPRDHGREFAHDGGLSAGKPRGAGFVFILVFVLAALVFGNVDREMTIYLILTVAAMMTGYLDDCAKVSWGELRKGLLDLMIAIMTAVTMVNFNGSDVLIAVTGQVIALPRRDVLLTSSFNEDPLPIDCCLRREKHSFSSGNSPVLQRVAPCPCIYRQC